MPPIDVESFGAFKELDGFFEEGCRLSGEHGFVDDTGSVDEEDVGWDGGF